MNENLIARIPLFASLPAEEVKILADSLNSCNVPPNTVLFREGEVGDRLTIIIEGEIDIIKALETEDERILATLGAGEFIGEMSLLYNDRLRSASARARSNVHMLEMTRSDFDAMLQRQPVMAFRIMQEMSERLRSSENATIRDLQEKNRELAKAYDELKAAQAKLIRKEKLEHELLMARRIQESILPKTLPVLASWEIEAYWQPAHAVSGDFYDFIELPGGKIGLVVGDVTDKGVPAALVMATTRTILRSTVMNIAQGNGSAPKELSPGSILAKVNNLLCEDMPPNMFVTCLFAVIDPASGEMRFANAGHDLPLQRTSTGVIELRATGMPLGLLPQMTYEEVQTVISSGDCLVLYSDGIIEAHNPQREMFGVPRVRSLFESPPPQDGWITLFLRCLEVFTGPAWEQEDDITFVTLHRS